MPDWHTDPTTLRDAYLHLLDQWPGAALLADGDQRVLACPPGVYTALGLDDGQALEGRLMDEIFPGLDQACKAARGHAVAYTYRRPDGDELNFAVTVAAVGKNFVWLFQDVSEVTFLKGAVLEAERREQARLRQVLHDQLSQQLLGAAFSAKMLATQLARQPPLPSVEEMNDLSRLINDCALQLREVTNDPATRAAEEGDFPKALSALAQQTKRAAIEIVCEDDSSIEFGRNTVILIQLIREAVNCAISAGAESVQLSCQGGTEEGVTVKIVSDDKTVNELTARPPTLVRKLYEYRCQALGANADFQSGTDPQAGSTITLAIPEQQ